MENIYIGYVLGLLTVMLIGMIVGIVRANIKVNKVDDNQSTFENNISNRIDVHNNDIYSRLDMLDKRIDGEIDRTNGLHKFAISYTDSRIDKAEQKWKTETGLI
jgi:hypothetical protein